MKSAPDCDGIWLVNQIAGRVPAPGQAIDKEGILLADQISVEVIKSSNFTFKISKLKRLRR